MKILTFGYITPHIEACPVCNAMIQCTDADLLPEKNYVQCPVCGNDYVPQYKIDEENRKK